MEKAYIILAHKDPEHLLRLVQRLDDGTSFFYVHIDKKSEISQFDGLTQYGVKVVMLDRLTTDWGGYNIVRATVNALKVIKKASSNPQRIILLSGQDYPIKSNRYIDDFLSNSSSSVFIDFYNLPNNEKWEPRGGMYRVDKYYFGLKGFQKLASKTVNFISSLIPILKRKMPIGMKPYIGSQWWIIDRYAMDYILNYIKENPGYCRFHRNTFGADELFFQMILLNSEDEQLRKSIRNNNMRYMDWEDLSKAHPEILTNKHFSRILNSEALFARKFDPDIDPTILQLIDEYCLSSASVTL